MTEEVDLVEPHNAALLAAPGQWPAVARDWRHIGSPLRPCPADGAAFGKVLSRWTGMHAGTAPRGLILGVTPELFALDWPERGLLCAADRTQAMIDHIWPGPRAAAMRTDWREIDLPDGAVDIVMCDGGLHLLDYPLGQAALASRLARIVAHDGLVAFRLFVPPPRRETAEAVISALNAGEIRDLNCLKLRLGMALQEGPEQGVALADVWRLLRSQVRNEWSELADRLGWPLEQLRIIDAYRDSGASYHFVTPDQAVAMFREAGFECVDTSTQAYEMGDQCPIVVFRKC